MKDPGFLARHSVKVNYPIGDQTGIGVGGNVDFFAEVGNGRQLAKILGEAVDNGLKAVVVGAGTKVVFSDFGYRGLVIRNAIDTFELDGDSLTLGSGVPVGEAVNRLAAEGFGGLASLAPLAGSVGGALWAGLPAPAVKALRSVTLISGSRTITVESRDYTPDRLRTGGEVAVSATFGVVQQPQEDIHKEILTATQQRLRTVPGARHKVQLFREPPKTTVARLADGLGLAGERVGGAMLSAKNPNYVINENEAKAMDIHELAQRVKYRVKLRRDVKLVDNASWLGEW